MAALVIFVAFIKACNFETKIDLNRLFDQFTGGGTKTEYTTSPTGNPQGSKDSKGPSNTEPSGQSPKQENPEK